MLLWLSLSLFLDLHISSTFHWVMEALDVSGFFCGGCSAKSSDSARQDCRTVYMLGMRKAAGQRERTQKLFMWRKDFSGSGQYYLDWKSLLNIHFVSVLVIWTVLVFPLFHPPPQSISEKKPDFTRLKENFWEVKRETNHSCPLAALWKMRVLLSPFSAAKPKELLGTI